MFGTRVVTFLAAWLVAVVVLFANTTPAFAQATADEQARMRVLQQRIDDMSKQLKQMQDEQTKTTKTVDTIDKAWNTFIKGFFGTMDVSIDYTTKGMSDLVAYHWGSAPDGGPPYVNNGPKAGPYGRVGWMAMMSSNGSNVGYRGSHKIGSSDVNFIYQVATSLNMAAAPGLQNTWTKSSNVVQGAIGLGDTYVGLRDRRWGTLKFGTMMTPYKTSTDRLNPFAGQLGSSGVVMGNTGGDNRTEFATRMDHVIAFNSPSFSGFSFDASYSFGQNVDPYNNLPPLGSPDCSGANNPGSGNLPLNCDDGGFNYSYGGDLKFEKGGLYLVAAFELHSGVSRGSDGIGSNNPYYGALPGASNGCTSTPNSPLLDCASYLAYAAEYPLAAAAGSPGYLPPIDVADEWAAKVGAQYRFEFGLTISYEWEDMHRNVQDVMQFQNERTRPNSQWLAIEYDFNSGRDRVAAGWAHAGATPGDPGGQHNYNPNLLGQNEANMYTVAYWHKFDKQLTWYIDAAETMNDGNAHFDIGAGTHGIKTDCHDATHFAFVDYSSAGPTTWGGCHEIGFSTGLNFKF